MPSCGSHVTELLARDFNCGRWVRRTDTEIFNTDQGAQFTSEDFTGRLEASGITISMDGRGRAMDNIFVERLWRTVKYEEVYLNDYEQVTYRSGEPMRRPRH